MGAKTWMLVGTSGSARDALAAQPQLDRDATMRLAQRLFPKERLEPLADGDLSYTCPPDDEVHIGCFSGVSVVAAKEFGIDYPSRLDPHFLTSLGERTIYLHAMHSVVDWLAFAVWQDGELQRSLSLAPDGVLEDNGARLPFEVPYWSGDHPAVDPEDEDASDYPLPFHPLELGEAALNEFFGYQLEGFGGDALFDAESVVLARLQRKKSRFWFWRRP